jgi:hypothetical protein
MKYHIRFVNQLSQEVAIHDALKETTQRGVAPQVPDVIDRARTQVVDDNDLLTPGEKGFRQVRSDKSRSTCNHRNHKCVLLVLLSMH